MVLRSGGLEGAGVVQRGDIIHSERPDQEFSSLADLCRGRGTKGVERENSTEREGVEREWPRRNGYMKADLCRGRGPEKK